MSPPRRVSRRTLVSEPGAVWNACIDLVALEETAALTAVQRVAHLAFWYDAEVQNGGHLQYFENSAGKRAAEAIEALFAIGAPEHAQVLRRAIQVWRKRERPPLQTATEFVAAAREGELEAFDAAFGKIQPDLLKRLENYFERHQSEFVELID